MRISATATTPMRKRSGRPLGARPWETTTPILPHRRPAACRRIRDISADLPRTIRPGPRSVLHQPGPFVGRLAQKDGRRARAAYRLRPASVHRKGDARRYLDGLKAPRQSKQSHGRGVRPRAAE